MRARFLEAGWRATLQYKATVHVFLIPNTTPSQEHIRTKAHGLLQLVPMKVQGLLQLVPVNLVNHNACNACY